MIEPVEFTAADGVTLRGELRPGDGHWAILVHDRDADLDSLAPLAAELAQNGFSVLAFDQRGHGLSDGTWTHEGATLDVEAACTCARARGAGQIVAAGAGTGGGALLDAAATQPIDAVVVLSPILPGHLALADLRRSPVPKLFIVGSQDATGEPAAREMHDVCIGPRLLVMLPSAAGGHELLDGQTAAQAKSHSVGYLAHHRIELGNTEDQRRPDARRHRREADQVV